MAIGLRVAAAQRLVGGPETTLTALAKLEQVLPAPLRRRVNALAGRRAAGRHPHRRRGLDRGARRARARLPRPRARALHLHRGIRRGHRGDASSRTRSRPPTGTGTCCAGTSSATTGAPSASTGSADVEHTRVLFEPRPLTPEQIEEFILVARSWVRTAVETDVVMDLPIDDDARVLRPVGPGRDGRGRRRARGGRWAAQDFRETMYGMSWIPAGVEYTTDLRRARALASCARRSSGCCGHWMPRRRLRCGIRQCRDVIARLIAKPRFTCWRLSGVGASVGSSRRSGRSRAPVHTRQRCGFDSRRRVHFRRAAIPSFSRERAPCRSG